jgi:intracellular sulfur oxidation DsrE/DsrF family protein
MRALIILLASTFAVSAEWPAPKAPAVPAADGYVEIPNAAIAPTKNSTYRAVFDATRPADKATALIPALNMAGSELNALAAVNAPLRNAKFAIVFHGAAVDGILDDGHYRAKFGTTNPNLKVIAEMKKQGVEFFACGQYLAGEKIDPKT